MAYARRLSAPRGMGVPERLFQISWPFVLLLACLAGVGYAALYSAAGGAAEPWASRHAVRFGFGFRYIAAGPCLQRDHAGLEVHAAAGAEMYPHFNNSPDVSSALTDRVAANKLGMKTGEGFYQWTPETIAAERARYEKTLAAAFQIIKAELDGRSADGKLADGQ
jgi:3-hydroxyacyl-CoA dehydrogenase